jgi:NitT/TauT family transport system substrate-binding protein
VRHRSGALLGAALFLLPNAAWAEARELRIGVQPGLTYLPFVLMQHDKMIEQKAEAAGLGAITVTWWSVAGGNPQNDAMLSGNLDIANSGTPAFFPMWARTRGNYDVRGIAAYNALPLKLNTNNPTVRTIKDFTDKDRIALPAVKASSQAILLQMASEKAFGQWDKLDAITVSRAHPDSMIALLSGRSEITAHFGAPPFQDQELRQPGIRTVLTGTDVTGGPITVGMSYTTKKFHDENPKLYGVFLATLEDAIARIKRDKRGVAETYLAFTKDKDTLDNIVAIINDPAFEFGTTPQNTVQVISFMHRVGSIKVAPAGWQDLFFAEIHAKPGS